MKMNKRNSMTSKTLVLQWYFPILLVGVFMFLLCLPFLLLPKGIYWLFAAILLLPLIPVLEGLLLTPAYARAGRFTYYSPLLLATKSAQGLDLHVGTLYDYIIQLNWSERGVQSQRQAMLLILQGLLSICDSVAEGKLSAQKEITATSYFFSHRSVEKLGFTLSSGSFEEKLNLAMVYLSLVLRLSFIRGRWSLPDLKRIRRIHTTAGALLQQRAGIAKMCAHLQSKHSFASDE
jgi:hypothetical protein